ncbi:hypothetical protein AC1031_014079 [Aphanomyces cochlioides]|nr:hypothetical protein AC1031_014079 [Aphanomyces cochlioides]
MARCVRQKKHIALSIGRVQWSTARTRRQPTQSAILAIARLRTFSSCFIPCYLACRNVRLAAKRDQPAQWTFFVAPNVVNLYDVDVFGIDSAHAAVEQSLDARSLTHQQRSSGLNDSPFCVLMCHWTRLI